MIEYESIDISEGIDKNACFVIIGIFYIITLVMDHIFAMAAII